MPNEKARPFLKWVGGKTQLLPELTPRVPSEFSQYFEPFIGGGALFFQLQPAKAVLTDINAELINVYQVIKHQPDELISHLAQHIYSKEYYYSIRNCDRTSEYQSWSKVRRASRLIYLNKTCFNGLYRVNSKGEFNTPMGRYKNPKIVDEANIKACSKALQNSQIINSSFEIVDSIASSSDFVYFDPPYAPLSTTSNFTGYSKEGFDEAMQLNLKELCDRLNHKGVRFMLSNSSAPLILDLYQDYKIELVNASRAINSKGSERGKIPEVIVTNY